MNSFPLEQWALIAEIGGALGVMATLIYLAIQFRQSKAQIQNQVESDAYERVFQAYDPVYMDTNRELFYNGLHFPEKLEDSDAFIFDLLMHRQFSVMTQVARQIELATLPPGARQNFTLHYQAIYLDSPGGREWFSKHYELAEDQLRIFGFLEQIERREYSG